MRWRREERIWLRHQGSEAAPRTSRPAHPARSPRWWVPLVQRKEGGRGGGRSAEGGGRWRRRSTRCAARRGGRSDNARGARRCAAPIPRRSRCPACGGGFWKVKKCVYMMGRGAEGKGGRGGAPAAPRGGADAVATPEEPGAPQPRSPRPAGAIANPRREALSRISVGHRLRTEVCVL